MPTRFLAWLGNVGTTLVRSAVAVTIVAAVPGTAAAQTPTILLASPTQGQRFSSGDTISIVVTSPTNTQLKLLAALDQFVEGEISLPRTLQTQIPMDAEIGPWLVAAGGATTSGEPIDTPPVEIIVERPDAPIRLDWGGPHYFRHPGYELPTGLTAIFADGVELEARESTLVTFSTSNPEIVLIDRHGMLFATGVGTATVTATYQATPKPLVATAKVTVERGRLTATPGVLQFGSHPLGSPVTQTVTLTNRHISAIGVTEVSSPPDYATVSDCLERSPLPPGGTCTATVTHTPSAPGADRSVLTVQTDFSSIAQGVPLFGEGTGLRASNTTLGSSANPATLGQAITLTATVTEAGGGATVPTGSVDVVEGATALGTAPLGSAGSGSLELSALGIGTHSLTASYAGDSSFGPSTSTPLSQVVRYAASGTACHGEHGHQILQPINADGTSVFNQGRTVPAKFRVCDSAGQSIGSPGVVQDFRLTQIIAGTTSDVNETVPSTTPDAAFRWDADAQQWVFNISTDGQQAQRTYVYTITLNDGTTISFRYGLR